MEKILIVVDMQNDFIDGNLKNKRAQAIVPKVSEKIKNFNGHIFCTLDTHYKDYLETLEGKKLSVEHCITNTKGHELNDIIYNSSNKIIQIKKETFGFIYWKDIFKKLFKIGIHEKEYIGTIELCGVCTSICVLANAVILRASYPNVKIIVDASCCACVSEESHKFGLEAIKMQQIEVIGE